MSTKMLVSRSSLTAIGAAIRSKNKSTDTYLPSEMGPAIEALEDPSVLTTKQVTENGTYDAADDEADGYSVVTVNVPNSYEAGDEGKVVSSGALVSQTSVTKTANGTYDTTLNNEVVVNVPEPDLGTKTITQNGTYSAEDDSLDGYSEVTVNVSGGGGGTPTISRADWNALTTAQKQAYGLVGIVDYTTGFNRGMLVNGTDYIAIGDYIPYSDQSKVICEAYKSNFTNGTLSWGAGASPITIVNANARIAGGDVYLPVNTNGAYGYVDLGANSTPFTAYIVAKTSSGTDYRRIVSAMTSRESGKGILLYGQTVCVSSWGDDTSTGISSTNWFVGAIQFAGRGSAFGLVANSRKTSSVVRKTPSQAGRYVTIGRTDTDADDYNAEPCNIYVRYFAVVSEAEDSTAVASNVQALVTQFL